MITILYITLIVITLVFFVGIFLIYRKFAPIIKKMMENLEKLNNINPNIKTEGYRNVMKEQIKEIQDYINIKIKK
jgi:predicted PurR-regulated permease PerM